LGNGTGHGREGKLAAALERVFHGEVRSQFESLAIFASMITYGAEFVRYNEASSKRAVELDSVGIIVRFAPVEVCGWFGVLGLGI